ncbi:M28 family peptidase [Pantoea sp.]|uniref:M28 family peptidase n=1 Tax=Pantoea TaxID=53335 RepID=UPI00291420B6|nr:M28 family peptidase [Pantoea sp.]MDU5476072.1 M28 family peptidase [Pantoea sp.]
MPASELKVLMRDTLSHFQHLHRLSGSADAEKSVDWLCEQLQARDIPFRRESCNLWLSDPLDASLTVAGQVINAKTRSFSAHCPDGVEAELFHDTQSLDFIPENALANWSARVRGKLVLADQGFEDYVQRLMNAGALGLIHIWGSAEAALHEETVGPVWGTPVPDDLQRYPTIPVISISQQDGAHLRSQLSAETLCARLTTVLHEHVAPCSLPVVELPGSSEEFVLLSSHYDSWHEGVTDNATGNALCLALATLFSEQRLTRGLRVAFWPGHSNARYGGSTWYADHFRSQLLDHCVAHINVDSPGCIGGSQLVVNASGAESSDWLNQAIIATTGKPAERVTPIGKGADQSFWGLGIPLHFALREVPEQRQSLSPGSGGGWWWHTEEDTLDKVDEAHLWRDFDIHQRWLESLLYEKTLPLDARQYLALMDDALAQLQNEIDPAFSLNPLRERLSALEKLISGKTCKLSSLAEATGLWHRARYRAGDDFHPDLSYHGGAFPGLQRLCGFRRQQCSERYWLMLETQFIRQRDRISELLTRSEWILRQSV